MSIALAYYQFPTWNATFTERIGGADLQVNPLVHEDVQLLRKLVARLAPDGEPFVVTPVWPGAYTLFDRKSPMWDIYALQPRDIELQEEEIAQIDAAKPAFVVVVDQPPESNALMLLRFTNPRIAAYIRSNYRETQDFEHTFNVHVYLPKHW
jgi:hypothetical protein